MRKFMPFILIILLLLVIFGLSAVGGSESYSWSETVAKYIKRALTFLGDKDCSITTIDLIIRKLAHFSEYLILTILLNICVFNMTRSKGYGFLGSIIIAIIISLVDEGVIQAASGRNNNFFDVFIDCMGIITGSIAFLLNVSLSIKGKK